MNSIGCNKEIGFYGIEYRSRRYDSNAVVIDRGLLGKASDYLYNWYYGEPDTCDQLCLTKRLPNRTIEVVSTEVTRQMIDAFINQTATSEETDKVIQFFTLATGRQLNYLSKGELIIISQWLLLLNTINSVEIIKYLVELLSNKELNFWFFTFLNNSDILVPYSTNLGHLFYALPSKSSEISMALSFNILKSYVEGNCSKLLLHKHNITDQFLKDMLRSHENVYYKLMHLVEFSDLLGHKNLTSELLIKILSLDSAYFRFDALNTHQKLLDHERMTPEFLRQILSLKDAFIISEVLVRCVRLMDHEQITSDFLIEVLSLANVTDILKFIETLASSNFLGKKLTPELLGQIVSLKKNRLIFSKLAAIINSHNLIRDNLNKEKQLTPELLSLFVSCDNHILGDLNSNPKLLNLGSVNLQKIFNADNRHTIFEFMKNLTEEELTRVDFKETTLSFNHSYDVS